MSREIKFRAWDNETNKYFEPTYQSYMGRLEELTIALSGRLQKRTCRGVADESTFHGRYVVEQFTGLKDKNGKDIYEGDILAWHSNIYRKHDWVGLVLYRGAGFAVQESDKSYSSPEWLDCACRKDANIIEVIGNVHDNPELLEVEK
ncbi:YopX family protein [Lentilactobacillus kefiri]|uniref:YopX family protein n=1 Tax=Lentilactobacillus kefiri TaxID=33962 RepID=UPI0025A282D7|nr:YopX family protein [Lentilactobacillus kefiri]MDM7493114.1 YopX family protein [Lentilactobacillus kefiri]